MPIFRRRKIHGPLELAIASPPYREKHVAQLWVTEGRSAYIFAEIDQDDSQLKIELWGRSEDEPWRFTYDEVVQALEEARNALGDA
jgi:hypothetical protein